MATCTLAMSVRDSLYTYPIPAGCGSGSIGDTKIYQKGIHTGSMLRLVQLAVRQAQTTKHRE